MTGFFSVSTPMRFPITLFVLLGYAASSGADAPDAARASPTDVRRAAQAETGALNLEQALDLAFERNPDLQAAAERIGQAQARVAEATAAFYPKLTGRVGYAYSNDPAMAFSAIVSQRRFNFAQNINQPGFVENFRPELVGSMSLYRGGSDYYRKKAAELGVEAAELERSALRNHLAASVTSAYYALLVAPRQVEVAHRSVEAVDSELKHAGIMYKEGALLKSDVLSLEVRKAQATETELKTLNAVDLARSGLKTLLGLGSSDPLEIREGADGAVPPLSEDLPKLVTQALAQRPDMQAAARQVEMREKELRAEQGGHLPRVNAYAAYGLNERSPEFNFNRDNLTMGINAEVDLFSGGATSARISGAQRRLAEARAIRERTRLEIEDEVQKAYVNLKEALERQQVAEAATGASEEALRLVHAQYRGGAVTVTRYLEAEADRAAAQMRAVTARYDARVAHANLQRAVGFWK
jgi:outer membrane protein